MEKSIQNLLNLNTKYNKYFFVVFLKNSTDIISMYARA